MLRVESSLEEAEHASKAYILTLAANTVINGEMRSPSITDRLRVRNSPVYQEEGVASANRGQAGWSGWCWH